MVKNFRNELDIIKPLLNIAKFLAVTPPNDSRHLKKYKFYSIFVCVIAITINNLWILEGGIKLATTISMNILSFSLSAAFNTIAILSSSFWNVEIFKQFYIDLKGIDKYLKIKGNLKKRRNQFLMDMVFIHFMVFGTFLWEVYVVISKGRLKLYTYYWITTINLYYTDICVLIMYNYCKALNNRHEMVNGRLQNIFKYSTQSCSTSSNKSHDNNSNKRYSSVLNTIISARRTYNKLIHLANLFNRLFGWLILLLFGTISIQLLKMIHLFAVPMAVLRWNTILILVSGVCSHAIIGIKLTKVCSATTHEAQKTATICYRLLCDEFILRYGIQNKAIRKELFTFADHASRLYPKFSANGFFNVDYSVLLGIGATVTSYVIVFTQLNGGL